MNHPLFGVIAWSMLSQLYVPKEDVADLKQSHGWELRTKLELIDRSDRSRDNRSRRPSHP